MLCFCQLFSQAKGGDQGLISIVERRIYSPLDEPRGPAIIPLKTPKHQEEAKEEECLEAGEVPEQAPHADDVAPTKKSPLWAEKLWLEQRGKMDTAHDQQLASILLARTQMDKYEISALLSKGRWRRILREGTVVIREGEPTTSLFFVLSGTLEAQKTQGGSSTTQKLHTISSQQMIGSLEFNEPEREHLAGETVISLEPCTYMAWDLDDLRELLAPRPHLRAQLISLIAVDLAIKFRQVECNFE
jgi:hypothetical protein